MAIEARSIDWVPETERHGTIWHQAPLWFLGNFQYFSIPIGFVGPVARAVDVVDDPRRRRSASSPAPSSWPSTRRRARRSACRR